VRIATETCRKFPSYPTGWQVSGVKKPNITGQPFFIGSPRFYPSKQNIQISALKNSSVFNLLATNYGESDCKPCNHASSDSGNSVPMAVDERAERHHNFVSGAVVIVALIAFAIIAVGWKN